MISGGIPNFISKGVMKCTKASKAPELLKMVMATIIPNKKGSKEIAILTPSFPPSTKSSYVGTRFIVAITKTTKIKQGIAHVLNVVIIPILFSSFIFIHFIYIFIQFSFFIFCIYLFYFTYYFLFLMSLLYISYFTRLILFKL